MEGLIHDNIDHFPHQKYADQLVWYMSRPAFDKRSPVKRVSVDHNNVQHGHVLSWDNTDEYIKFANMEAQANKAADSYRKTVDTLFDAPLETQTVANVARSLAFALAYGAVDDRAKYIYDGKPIYIEGNHVYRVFSDESGDKVLHETLAHIPEPFQSAMVQTWRHLKLYRASWDTQKAIGNEISAFLFDYANDLFQHSLDHCVQENEVPTCSSCGSHEVERVVKSSDF